MRLKLISSAFQNNDMIPDKYACTGENISPPLSWDAPPEDTESLIVICEDMDASYGWIHWVVYNIPPSERHLPEGLPTTYELDHGIRQGMNDSRHVGYIGPCPPKGAHRYIFRLYALDIVLDAHMHMTKEDLMRQIRGHVLASGEYTGLFRKEESQ